MKPKLELVTGGKDGKTSEIKPTLSSDLLTRFGATADEVRAEIKPMVLWMCDHGITDLRIQRDGAKAMLTINGRLVQ